MMADRMSAEEFKRRNVRPRKQGKRVDREGPIHKAILSLLIAVLPARAVIHHSPNELQITASPAARAIAVNRAKALGMRAGWPDLEWLLDGRMYFFEVKAPDGKESADQADIRAQLIAAGALVEVVASVEQAEAALKKWGLM